MNVDGLDDYGAIDFTWHHDKTRAFSIWAPPGPTIDRHPSLLFHPQNSMFLRTWPAYTANATNYGHDGLNVITGGISKARCREDKYKLAAMPFNVTAIVNSTTITTTNHRRDHTQFQYVPRKRRTQNNNYSRKKRIRNTRTFRCNKS